MKRAIIVLSVILALLLVVAGVLYFTTDRTPAQPAPSETSAPTTTEQPTTQMTTTEPPTTTTEPPTVLIPAESVYILSGKAVECYTVQSYYDTLYTYIRASDFAEATGLTLESEQPLRLTGADTVESTDDGILANGKPFGHAATYIYTTEEGGLLPLPETAEALGYPIWTDEESGITYITPAARAFDIPEDVNVPVLMYHAVSDNMWGIDELFVSPSSMDEQLAYLVENGYDPIWFEDLAHIEDYDKPVILTFDDGYDDNYNELLPLLQKHQVKATVFVIGNAAGMTHKMTEEQIREMADSGLVSIQSHGYTHDDMDAMGEETLEYELSETKKVITRITGRIPYVLCYPTGKYSNLTLEVAARHYLFGIKMVGGQYNTSDDPFLVSRFYISRYTDIYTFASYISAAGT